MSLLMQFLSIPIPQYIHELQFSVDISEDMKTLTIYDSSVNFREMFNSFIIIDSNNNELKLRSQNNSGGRVLKTKLKAYNSGDEIKMTFQVNILNPIASEIRVTVPCKVVIKINTTNGTLSYSVSH